MEPGTWNFRRRRAFTLTELLIVIAIISIMAGLALSAVSGAMELAREQRTRAIINKLDQLIMERYEEYRTRAVPIRVTAGTAPATVAQNRLSALRALMRMELPDRRTDVVNFNTNPPSLEVTGVSGFTAQSALQKAYFRAAVRSFGGAANLANWTSEHEGAECLYLIVGSIRDGDKSALDFFSADEIGDTDGDGMKEILDGWRQPIEFIRWPSGFVIENGALTTQSRNYTTTTNGANNFRVCDLPDPFDPVRADPRWTLSGTDYPACFYLRPLIYSAGRDKKYDIASQLLDSPASFRYAVPPSGYPNDPFINPPTVLTPNTQTAPGTPGDTDNDGYLGYSDNITNHYQETP